MQLDLESVLNARTVCKSVDQPAVGTSCPSLAKPVAITLGSRADFFKGVISR